jgi:hypothetical protein
MATITSFSKGVQDTIHLLPNVFLDFNPVCSYVGRQAIVERVDQVADGVVWYVFFK